MVANPNGYTIILKVPIKCSFLSSYDKYAICIPRCGVLNLQRICVIYACELIYSVPWGTYVLFRHTRAHFVLGFRAVSSCEADCQYFVFCTIRPFLAARTA